MKIVTNNPKVKKLQTLSIDFYPISYGEVLACVKEMVIREHVRLLSHPLSGSIKPNETYYKTIIIDDKDYQEIDLESLEYMEFAEETYQKFLRNRLTPNWSDKVLEDFAFVDFYITQSTLQRLGV